MDECAKNECISEDQFIELILLMCENEKNLHMRIGCILWLSKSVNLYYDKSDKIKQVITKRINAMLKKEINLRLKEACQCLLLNIDQEEYNESNKNRTNYGKYCNTL